MRHEKIIPADDLAPIAAMDADVEILDEDVPAEEAKAPPVAQQHFWYSGRAPRRAAGTKAH